MTWKQAKRVEKALQKLFVRKLKKTYRGLRPSQIAVILGLSREMVSQYLRGRRGPSLGMFFLLKDQLGITDEEIEAIVSRYRPEEGSHAS